MTSGIYKIACKANGKFYIGSAVDIKKRWVSHIHQLKHSCHHNPKMMASWKKYGKDAFEFSILLVCNKSDLVFYEQLIMDGFEAVSKGFNAAPTAGSTMLGFRHSDESRRKMSKPFTDERKKNISNATKGRKLSKEHVEKLRLAGIGRVTSDETKAKLSKIHKGRIISQEQRDKISATLMGTISPKRGTKLSDDVRAKISAKLKGRKMPDEIRKKIAKSLIGRRVSSETIKKISETNKKTQALRRSFGLGRNVSLKSFAQAGAVQ